MSWRVGVGRQRGWLGVCVMVERVGWVVPRASSSLAPCHAPTDGAGLPPFPTGVKAGCSPCCLLWCMA